MRILIIFCFLAFLSGQTAHARVDGRFLSFIGMVALTDRVMGQVTDDDPQRLYELMNVPPQDSSMGKGKAIKLGKKDFTLVCTDRGGGQTVCSITVKQGPQGTVSPSQGVIRFVALGQEAAAVHGLFFADPQSGRMDYVTEDGTFRISSDGEVFQAEYRRPK